MLRKFGFFVVFFGLALPVLAVDSPGSISGYVRSTAGVPQMGAAVEVLSAAARTLKVFTDENGFYSIHDLLPGNYSLKVTAPSFLPALRDRIIVATGDVRPTTEETLARLGVRYVRKPFNLRDLRVEAARLWEATALS